MEGNFFPLRRNKVTMRRKTLLLLLILNYVESLFIDCNMINN